MATQISTINGDNSTRSASKMSGVGDEGKLFVGALSRETTVESLQQYFSIYGEVVDCNVKIDQITKRSRGFGFVQFKEASSAQRVLKEGPHVIDGKKVDPKKAAPQGKPHNSTRTKKIFVGGLKPDTPDEIVRNYFSQYGAVVDIDLVKEKETNRRRGFCFVEFDSEDVVDLVMQKQYHDLAQGIKVEVKPALTKEQQAAKKAHEMGGFRGLGRGMVGASFGYGVPAASYGQYQTPTVLYQTADPSAAGPAYSIGYPPGYSQPGAVAASPYAGVPGYDVQPAQSFATVRYPVAGRGYGVGNPGANARYHPYAR
ncbi:heterogeneous nuclear ribonucleo A B-like isoform X2 [Paramuricea clavata]|uniref:Heterogeneous nuclear ribonucleo A B-like isoform X2 n=1 Tax=Paramuricea clavata TaxID=317549 RepID=A0A6S7FKK3_PARCT|nr:heterogeneous nuclear ribonucleo A B-like isoform X2 [Paramuricea clavata]